MSESTTPDGDFTTVQAVNPLQHYGYVRVYHAVVQSCGIQAAFLYGILEQYAQIGAHTGKGAIPSHAILAQKMNCGVRSIANYLDQLRESKWISWESGANRATSNTYFLLNRVRTTSLQNMQTIPANIADELEERSTSSSPNVEDDGRRVSVSKTERRTRIDPAWRPDRNLAAHILDLTGWDQPRLDREILKFIRWHEEKQTKNVDWRAAFRKWITKAIEIEKRDDDRDSQPQGLVL